MELLSIDMGAKQFADARVLLYGKCVPQRYERYLRKFSRGRIAISACLQEQHMDNLGFKLATLLTYQPVREITVLTIDGSPHCAQLHAAAEQAKRITRAPVAIKHYVIEEGRLEEVTADTVKIARHLSAIRSLEAGKKPRI